MVRGRRRPRVAGGMPSRASNVSRDVFRHAPEARQTRLANLPRPPSASLRGVSARLQGSASGGVRLIDQPRPRRTLTSECLVSFSSLGGL